MPKRQLGSTCFFLSGASDNGRNRRSRTFSRTATHTRNSKWVWRGGWRTDA
jgi:hypothetical protein